MSLRFKPSLPAYPGNTLVEYGVVASLVLLVTIPGLYLVGGQVQQWTDSVKTDMAEHRDRAMAISAQARAQSIQNLSHRGKTIEIAGTLGHPGPNSSQNTAGNTGNSNLHLISPTGPLVANGNTQTISVNSITGAGILKQNHPSKNNPGKTPSQPTKISSGNGHPGQSSSNNPTTGTTSVTGGYATQTPSQPSGTTITLFNGSTYSIPFNNPFTGVTGTGSVRSGLPANSPANGHSPNSKGSLGNGKGNGNTHGAPTTSNPPVIVTGSQASPPPHGISLGNGQTYVIPTKGNPFTGVAGTASVKMGTPPNSHSNQVTLNNGSTYMNPSPNKTTTQVAGSQGRPAPPSSKPSTTSKQSTNKSTSTKKQSSRRTRTKR